jgi:signal transduction histidine kinase
MRRMATSGSSAPAVVASTRWWFSNIGSRWLNLPIRYKCAAVVALPVACLMFEIGWQMRALRALEAAQEWTAHTRQVLLAASELRALLLQLEANTRGYMLTNSAAFLPPLRDAEIRAPLVARQICDLVKDNPSQLARAQELQELARLKVAVTHENVAAFIADRSAIDNAEMIERMLRGKSRMDAFNPKVALFVAEEDRLLTERMKRRQQQQSLSWRVLVMSVGIGIAMGFFAILLFSMGVATRLSTLSSESRRIAVGELMPEPPPGRDEVSELAWSLHAASHKIYDQMQGLEALNRDLESFSYSVSHDLRSPLRHIHGFSKILRSDFSAELPAEAQRYLSRIESGAERMGHLIDDLLNFSRLGRRNIERQPVPLRLLVDNVVEELSESVEGRKIEWRMERLPNVQGDPALIKLVFVNLLGNAIKFTRTRTHARIEVGSHALPQGAAIYVRDNGVGFDMKFADKLFGVFQRLHRLEEFEGTGVGLATVARIVHRHGGSVWAESAVDQGATFYFTLGEGAGAPVPLRNQPLLDEVLYAAAR